MLRVSFLLCALSLQLSCGYRKTIHHAEGIEQHDSSVNTIAGHPFQKSSRLVIVGAGPAGIHMASRLKQMGYAKVTILERTNRVGGKSYTIYRNSTGGECTQTRAGESVDTSSCVAHEMGTCFLHNGYHTIRNLVAEYGITPEIAPELASDFKNTRAMFSRFAKDQWHAQPMADFVSASIMDGIKSGDIRVPLWARRSETLSVLAALVEAVSAYNKLHKELFGDVEFSMPERLSAEALDRLDMTFYEFLDSNNLQALAGFLMFAHAAQGYGYVKSIPAYYGLLWISPELLNGYVQMSMHQRIEEVCNPENPIHKGVRKWWIQRVVDVLVGGDAEKVYRTTTVMPEGYESIWRTMANADDLDIKFGVSIATGGIDRQLSNPSSPVRVTYSQGEGAQKTTVTEEYDFLIYTAPHAHAAKYVRDIVSEERSIFSSLQSFVLSTTLYTADAVQDYTDTEFDAPIMYNADKMDNKNMDGGWYADRNDPRIFAGDKRQTSQARVGYQFYEDYCEADAVMCDTDRTPDPSNRHRMQHAPKVLERFYQEMQDQKISNVKVIDQFAWPYFFNFPLEEITKGRPWDLVDMQGSQKTWWIGASAVFESVHDVTNYNLMILKKYLGAVFKERRLVKG